MFKIFLAVRLLFRFVPYFIQQLRVGNPYAIGSVVLAGVFAIAWGFLRFARKPLGGDPDKPLTDYAFQDDANPYRDL